MTSGQTDSMDFLKQHGLVHQACDDVRAGRSLVEVMATALDSLEEHWPIPLWEQVRAVDFREDVRLVAGAIPEIVGLSPPPKSLAAVWFGLYEIALGDGDELDLTRIASAVTLSGGTGYPGDEWGYQQEWYPDGYLPTPGLAGLAGEAARADAALEADGREAHAYRVATFDLAFAHSLALAADVMRGPAGAVLLGEHARLGVASGFHDGDVAFLGELTPSGLDTSSLHWGWT